MWEAQGASQIQTEEGSLQQLEIKKNEKGSCGDLTSFVVPSKASGST
jgi:hypothetical protein